MPPLALPIRLNFSVGTTVAGYTTVRTTDLYSAPVGFGYTSPVNMLEVDGLGANPDDRFDEVHAKLSANNLDDFRIDIAPGVYDVLAYIGHPVSAISNTRITLSFNSGATDEVLSVGESAAANVFLVRSLKGIVTTGNFIQLEMGIVMGAPNDSAIAILHIQNIEGIKSTLESKNAVSTKRVP